MKHTTLLFAILLAGCQTIDIPKPTINIPPITIPTGGQPDQPATPLPDAPKGQLLQPLSHLGNPSQVSELLGRGGYECGDSPDIRISLMQLDGRTAWIYRNYFGLAIKSLGNGNYTGMDFNNPDGMGRYYFIAGGDDDWLHKVPRRKVGEAIKFTGKMWFYWELRDK